MRFLKKYRIFESAKSYTFNPGVKEGNQYVYYFDDEFGNQFRVEFDYLPDGESEVRYLVKKDNHWTYEEVHSNIWRITQTIFGLIIPDFIKSNNWCQMIIIKGLAKDKESDEITKRTKFYMRFLQRNPIEGWSVDRYGNEIYLDRN